MDSLWNAVSLSPISTIHEVPGVGYRKTINCGKVVAMGVCESDKTHRHVPIKCNCGNVRCKICFPAWNRRSAKRFTEHGVGVLRSIICVRQDKTINGSTITPADESNMAKLENAYRHHTYHMVVKPKDGMIKESDPKQTVDDLVREFMKEYGSFAGRGFYHPYTISGDAWMKMQPLLDTNKSDRMQSWKIARDDELNLGDWYDYVDFRPHTHIVASMFDKHIVGKTYFINEGKYEGWSVKVIRKIEINDHDNMDLYRTYLYLSDHCCVDTLPSGRVANISFTYGLLAPSVMKVTSHDIVKYCECRECHSRLLKYGVDSFGNATSHLGTDEHPAYYTKTVIVKQWAIRRMPAFGFGSCPLQYYDSRFMESRHPNVNAIVDPPDPIW